MYAERFLELKGLPLGDAEIMARLQEAYINRQEEVVFNVGGKSIKVKISHTAPQGCMRDYEQYY